MYIKSQPYLHPSNWQHILDEFSASALVTQMLHPQTFKFSLKGKCALKATRQIAKIDNFFERQSKSFIKDLTTWELLDKSVEKRLRLLQMPPGAVPPLLLDRNLEDDNTIYFHGGHSDMGTAYLQCLNRREELRQKGCFV